VNPYVAFHDPVWLLALLAVPAVFWVRQWRRATVFLVPFSAAWHAPSAVRHAWWPLAAGSMGFALLTLALARPQRVQERWETQTFGYDIMLAVDLSTSMLTEDYERDGKRINRFEAVKPILKGFIAQRPNDRIGIVLFAGLAYTLSPLTFDHGWLGRQIERIHVGMIEDGTAIGDGIVLALERLKQPAREIAGRRKGAFVVLLTDGVNNTGLFTPKEARVLAAQRGVPVFTIATGRNGWVPVPYVDAAGRKIYREEKSELDEEELWMIAVGTGGEFFRGHDRRTLSRAFGVIDRSQKIAFESRHFVRTAELFPWFAVPGALLVGLGAVAIRPLWRKPVIA
jgi:Ca-activated chloride channel family protein